LLADREQARGLARALDPLIRAVDWVVGEKVAMLVEVEYEGEAAALRVVRLGAGVSGCC
jgi:hypothetical protein